MVGNSVHCRWSYSRIEVGFSRLFAGQASLSWFSAPHAVRCGRTTDTSKKHQGAKNHVFEDLQLRPGRPCVHTRQRDHAGATRPDIIDLAGARHPWNHPAGRYGSRHTTVPSRQVPTVNLLPFLEEARERDILHTVGAVYQFRHARLQDQLSGGATANYPTSPAQRSS